MKSMYLVIFVFVFASLGFANDSLKKQDACDVFSNERVAQLLDVDKELVKEKDMSFGKRRSICYYYTAQGNRKLFVRLAWKSSKATGNKVLQKQYAGYLLKGEKSIKEYKEVGDSDVNQLLFGIGQDDEGKYIHILRKRFGNSAEAQIEIVKEKKDEKAKEVLMSAMGDIS